MEEAKKYLPENIEYVNNSYEACTGADAVILMTEWNQYRALDLDKIGGLMREKVFIDLRNVYEPEKLKKKGFSYTGVGRA